MQIVMCLVELHIPQYTPLCPQMQALISNNQELGFRRNELNTAVCYRFRDIRLRSFKDFISTFDPKRSPGVQTNSTIQKAII